MSDLDKIRRKPTFEKGKAIRALILIFNTLAVGVVVGISISLLFVKILIEAGHGDSIFRLLVDQSIWQYAFSIFCVFIAFVISLTGSRRSHDGL